VRKVTVTFAGKPVMIANVNFSISENPNFRFYFVPRANGELKAQIEDTQDRRFESVVAVSPQPVAAQTSSPRL
jgi:sulfur-oxidizing protein SoxY